MTDMTYLELFDRSRTLRRRLVRAKTSSEAANLKDELAIVQRVRLALHSQMMELLSTFRMAS